VDTRVELLLRLQEARDEYVRADADLSRLLAMLDGLSPVEPANSEAVTAAMRHRDMRRDAYQLLQQAVADALESES
jgi:hypothetical protein